MQWKLGLSEQDIQYVPPKLEDGSAKGAVLLSEGVEISNDPVVSPEVETKTIAETESVISQTEADTVEAEDVVTDEAEVVGDALVGIAAEPSQLGDEEGGSSESSAGTEGYQDVVTSEAEVETSSKEAAEPVSFVSEFPLVSELRGSEGESTRHRLVQATAADKSLGAFLKLAEKGEKGFELDKGLLFRRKLDQLGSNVRQL